MRIWAALCVGSLVVLAALPAHADAKKARVHFERGTTLYNLNRFDEALTAYESAYTEKRDPAFLFNIGQCHRQLGHKLEAIRFYRTYLRESPTARNRPEVERRIGELEEAMASDARALQAPPVGTVEPESPPVEPPPPVLAAPPVVAQQPLAPPPPVESPPLHRRWWFWAGIGAVVVGAVALGIGLSGGDKERACRVGAECL